MRVLRAIGRLVKGTWWLFVGMVTTTKHFLRRAITVQYPKERFEQWPRFRGRVAMVPGDDGGHKCTACAQCIRVCPAACITLERHKEEDVKGFVVDGYVIDMGLCIYCGLCVEVCNFDALATVPEYEMSVYDKAELVYDIPKLLSRQLEPEFKK
jgi:NADH-quinone oxidoreductase subunit I